MREFFWRLVETLFYRPVRAEYIRFDQANEYLITYLNKKRFVPLFVQKKTVLLSSISRDSMGRYLMPQVHLLKNKQVPVETKILTWEEFNQIAFDHPVLKDDDFVIWRKIALDSGLAIR